MKSDEEKTEENIHLIKFCGLGICIIGLMILISPVYFYIIGFLQSESTTIMSLIVGFAITQLGIDIMLISWIKKVEIRGKRS